MKKVFTLLFAILTISILTAGLLGVEANAATSGKTGDCTWTLDDKGVLTIFGNGAMKDYYTITSNGPYSYPTPWGKSITKVVIENGVTSIGNWAFEDCSSLTSVNIGNGVTSIGSRAFYYCISLKEIYLPQSVTAIRENTFNGCTALTDIWYAGSKSDRDLITRESGNDALLSATWHFNTCAPDAHTYDNAEDLFCNVCGHERPPYTSGDLDGKEGVDMDDAIYLLFYTFYADDYPLNQPCDFDHDGDTDMDDAIYLLFHTFYAEDYPLQ